MEQAPQHRRGILGPAGPHQIVSLMRGRVHTLELLAPGWIAFHSEIKAGDGPQRIQLRLAINQVLELGGSLEMRNHFVQRAPRKILDRHNVSGIYAVSHGITVT